MTEPAVMGIASRGSLTDQYHIHITWHALIDDDIRGSVITSYYI
jgi:hypothetical protein